MRDAHVGQPDIGENNLARILWAAAHVVRWVERIVGTLPRYGWSG